MRSTEGRIIGVALIENVMAAQDRTFWLPSGSKKVCFMSLRGKEEAWIRGRCSSVGARM